MKLSVAMIVKNEEVMLSDYLATFTTDRGNILINSEPENNDSNFLIEQ